MAFDWGYFFSLFSIGAFWQACVTVIVISTLSWGIGLVVGFLLACAKLSAPRETVFVFRDRGTGRPTKKERRELDGLMEEIYYDEEE